MLVEELLLNNLFIVLNQKFKINNYNLITFISKFLDLSLDLKQGVQTGQMPSLVNTVTSHYNPNTGDNKPFCSRPTIGTYCLVWDKHSAWDILVLLGYKQHRSGLTRLNSTHLQQTFRLKIGIRKGR